jgi:hypothetical protein
MVNHISSDPPLPPQTGGEGGRWRGDNGETYMTADRWNRLIRGVIDACMHDSWLDPGGANIMSVSQGMCQSAFQFCIV